jgi:hypothetical protein
MLVRVAEQFADGQATDEDLKAAEAAFTWAEWEPGISNDPYLAALATEAVTQLARESDAAYSARTRRAMPGWPEQAYQAAAAASNQVAHMTPLARRQEQWDAQVRLLRCIFGNPFRPVALGPSRLSTAVTSLARATYEERALPSGELDLARLTVLADALEEASCNVPALLAHVRDPGPHVRGCWPVDLLLDKG